ncbi:hypothetical protein E1B28_011734 [Marasmius oreades]|uniref:Uncharacterized protein n=1 Tax=Marasmius oreades TaxID=181124 RepID=A0A9P7UQJ3_9AGAR|nr:uncharacterized protein E1B28_011734 [Marasmius oreades]KAG7090125.1 hypothetical protein E1B28_011734 [Marasmius oreades]
MLLLPHYDALKAHLNLEGMHASSSGNSLDLAFLQEGQAAGAPHSALTIPSHRESMDPIALGHSRYDTGIRSDGTEGHLVVYGRVVYKGATQGEEVELWL